MPDCPICSAGLEADLLLDPEWLYCWTCRQYWRCDDGLLVGPVDRLVPFLP